MPPIAKQLEKFFRCAVCLRSRFESFSKCLCFCSAMPLQCFDLNTQAYPIPACLFQARYPNIKRIGCNAHALDLALEDIGEMSWAAKAISEAKEVGDML